MTLHVAVDWSVKPQHNRAIFVLDKHDFNPWSDGSLVIELSNVAKERKALKCCLHHILVGSTTSLYPHVTNKFQTSAFYVTLKRNTIRQNRIQIRETGKYKKIE